MRIYKCNKCDKIFTHKNDYKKHISRKTDCSNGKIIEKSQNKNTTSFKCSKCNKLYSRNDSLKRHTLYFCKDSTKIMNNNPPDVDRVTPISIKNKKEYKC